MQTEIIDINGIDREVLTETNNFFGLFTPESAEKLAADDIKRTLAGKFLLRRMIRRMYGERPVNIRYGINGKPELDFCFFSISHSGNYAACAVSDRPCGIDIEISREIKQRKKYPLFTEDECRYVNVRDSANRFLTLWTMKEAFVKANGGRLADAAKAELVKNGAPVNKLGEYGFKTYTADGYLYSVCEYGVKNI